ncbi:MAG: DegT/DnrJ/EryC1/StrS family aminotransferase [Saprospiraceae bacterium]|nr:DegT/DnrJ/EryC1/StrS family aminotransferase [Saprospiraceae bacterium]
MDSMKYHRRSFIKQNSLAGLGAGLGLSLTDKNWYLNIRRDVNIPALLGGRPIRDHGWPDWPIWNPETDEKLLLEVMRSGVWSRSKIVALFEQKWAEMSGAKRCLAVVNGTNALNTSLAQLDVGWGDEVIVSPYSFIASVSCIMFNGAIPIFVDVDPATFQIDPAKIEAKISSNTKAILPVHILGLPCDMDPIMQVAKKHDLVVIEDACQAWLAEYNGQKVGTFGDAGCFSFQNSKHLPMGEGGAIVSDDDDFMDRCFSYHNYGNPYGAMVGSVSEGAVMVGTKLRITEYQAAIGLAQMERLDKQTEMRNQHAKYLASEIADLPGISPYRLYDKVDRAAFHLFPFRYQSEVFKGLSRDKFVQALSAEGIPCSSGYKPLNKMPYLKNAFESNNFKKFYSTERLNFEEYMQRNHCPLSDKLCYDEAVWIPQYVLLGTTEDLDYVGIAIEKIQRNAEKLK